MIFLKKFKQYIIQPRNQIYDINDDRFMLTDKTHIKVNGLIYGYTANKSNTYTFYLIVNNILITQMSLNMHGNIRYILAHALLTGKMILEFDQIDNEEYDDDDYINSQLSNYSVTIIKYIKDLRYVHANYAHPYYTDGVIRMVHSFTIKNINGVIQHKLFNGIVQFMLHGLSVHELEAYEG